MEASVILLLLAILASAVLFVAYPFFAPSPRQRRGDRQFVSLQKEHKRILESLQELDFEHSLGKISAEEYPQRRIELLKQGAAVLRQLDRLAPQTPTSSGEKSPGSQGAAPKSSSLSDDDLEDLIAKRRAAHRGKTAGFCPKCGKPALQSDLFCSSCGEALKK